MTKKAEAILGVLRASEGHMTAEEIYLACRRAEVAVSLATVYRCLKELSDAGHIRRFSVTGEPEYYDKTLTPHEHLFCSRCRRVIDARGKAVKELLEETYGVALESYDLSMHIVCEACRARSGT